MEIETAALIRYDLCHQSQSESLLESLESLYDDEGEQFGERVLGGQQWERYRFDGDIQTPDEKFDAFDSMTTLVSFETRHLIDIVTIAELATEHITEFQEKEPSRTQYLIDELIDQLTGIAGEIPTVAPADINRQTVQLYTSRCD